MRTAPRYAVVALLVLGASLVAADTVRTARTTDLFCFWTGARLVLEGRNPYHEATWKGETSGVSSDRQGVPRLPPCPGRYGYPLTTAVALAPIGALPFEAAAVVWLALAVGGGLVGTLLIWRAAGGPSTSPAAFTTLVFVSQPFVFTLYTAQFGGVLLGLLGAVLALEHTRPRLAGAALALLALKPHIVVLAVAVPLAWARRGQHAALVGALACGALLLAASVAARPAWPLAWASELATGRAEMMSGAPTTWSLAERLVGTRWAALALLVPLAVAFAFLVRRRLATFDLVATSLLWSLLLTPYAGGHDQVLLAPAWARILATGLSGRPALVIAAVAVASLLPWVLYAYALAGAPDDTASAVVIVATALAHLAALGPSQRSTINPPLYP